MAANLDDLVVRSGGLRVIRNRCMLFAGRSAGGRIDHCGREPDADTGKCSRHPFFEQYAD